MSVTLGSTPTAIVYEVEDVVSKVVAGEIRIPEFQRPFRWGIEDARRLFDSILNGYPVGSLLLWSKRAEAARIVVGNLKIDAPPMDKALWVVDGQQRLTTLANALTESSAKDERFALSLDLRQGKIISVRPLERPRTIPLYVLYDLQRLILWFRDRPEDSEYFEAATTVATKLRRFKIPASVVETDDEQVLREIFDRLNNYGKRLTRTEVFSALHPAPSSDGRDGTAGAIDEIGRRLAIEQQFGTVDNDTILAAVLARRGPDITRDIRAEFDIERRNKNDCPGEDAKAAFTETGIALAKAVDFLRDDCGIPHFAFLPYHHLLVVLTRLFAHFEITSIREKQLLRRWLWRAAAAGTNLFAGSNTGTTRGLNQLIVPGDQLGTIDRLLAAVPHTKVGMPDAGNFRTNTAAGKIVACAMWSMQPRSLRDGERLTASDLLDSLGDAQTPRSAMTAIVSRSSIGDAIQKSDTASRWLLLPGVEMAPTEIVPAIVGRSMDISPSAWDLTLHSHVLSAESIRALSSGDRKRFVTVRTMQLNSVVHSFLERNWEFGHEDTPPLQWLVVDDLEADSDSDA